MVFEPSGLIDFKIAWDWQKKWQEMLFEKPYSPQAAWLLEHLSCYTLGKGAAEENLLFNLRKPPSKVYRVDRGGEVTYHLPGQLVVYLVLDLHRYQTDLNWYLRELELVILDVLKDLGLEGDKILGKTGVWIDGIKVASIGIGCRRWITQHGLALNIDCDLSGFAEIIPCGLKGCRVGKLSSWIKGLTVDEVKPLMKNSLNKHFGFV